MIAGAHTSALAAWQHGLNEAKRCGTLFGYGMRALEKLCARFVRNSLHASVSSFHHNCQQMQRQCAVLTRLQQVCCRWRKESFQRVLVSFKEQYNKANEEFWSVAVSKMLLCQLHSGSFREHNNEIMIMLIYNMMYYDAYES